MKFCHHALIKLSKVIICSFGSYLENGQVEFDLKVLLDTKKGLDAVVKFLDSLPQLLC